MTGKSGDLPSRRSFEDREQSFRAGKYYALHFKSSQRLSSETTSEKGPDRPRVREVIYVVSQFLSGGGS